MSDLQGWLKDVQPNITAFCQRLLQTPSVNGVHNEIDVVHVIATEANTLGLGFQITGDNPNRPNIIVSTNAHEETGLLLVGHTDTVPAGDEAQWSYPPFGGEIADGKIYGRGAVDTKGGIAASIYALAALQYTNALPKGRAQFIGVPDEETGATGTLGIKYLYRKGLLKARGAIYAYSGDVVHIGHRGLVRYRITARGQAEHTGAEAWQNGEHGANAVTAMSDLLLRLEREDLPHSSIPYFTPFRTMITPGTMIQGGVSINIVPDTCDALIDIRTTPEYNLERIEDLLQNHMDAVITDRPNISFEVELLNDVPAVISDRNAPIFNILSDVTEEIRGIKPHKAIAGPANEGYLLIERGIPTVCGFGPHGENFHGIDEYVVESSLVETAHIFAETARRLASF